MQVQKRNENLESVRFDKITSRLNHLIYNLGIDPVIITQKIANSIFDGIKTSEIDELAANICTSMILDTPEYGILASRLIVDNHQKNTSDSFKDVVKLDSRGFIQTMGLAETSVKGIFAAGDCREGAIAQVAAATGEGVLASYGIRNFLK